MKHFTVMKHLNLTTTLWDKYYDKPHCIENWSTHQPRLTGLKTTGKVGGRPHIGCAVGRCFLCVVYRVWLLPVLPSLSDLDSGSQAREQSGTSPDWGQIPQPLVSLCWSLTKITSMRVQFPPPSPCLFPTHALGVLWLLLVPLDNEQEAALLLPCPRGHPFISPREKVAQPGSGWMFFAKCGQSKRKAQC